MTRKELFNQIFAQIQEKFNDQQIFREANSQFLLKPFKLSFFSFSKTQKNYSQLTQKYNDQHLLWWEDEWHKNQRKIFIQFLIYYSRLKDTNPEQMGDSQWDHLSKIFFNKKPIFLKFQGLSIMKNTKKINWSNEDDNLIKRNIQQCGQRNWNQISKQIFYQTECKKYFSPKHIRERWYNHLSLTINRSQWSAQQDIKILQHVAHLNKRWCQIVKQFKYTRTEHMVKNRFKFLTRQASRSKDQQEKRCIRRALDRIKKKNKKLIKYSKPPGIRIERNLRPEKSQQQNGKQTGQYRASLEEQEPQIQPQNPSSLQLGNLSFNILPFPELNHLEFGASGMEVAINNNCNQQPSEYAIVMPTSIIISPENVFSPAVNYLQVKQNQQITFWPEPTYFMLIVPQMATNQLSFPCL